MILFAISSSNESDCNAGNDSTRRCSAYVYDLFHCYKMVQQGEVSSGTLMEVKTMRIPESYERPKADSSECFTFLVPIGSV